MKDYIEALSDKNNIENKNDKPFVKFVEDYYGYFNKKLMSLNLINIGNILVHKKENKIKKMKKIILVRSIHISYLINYTIFRNVIVKVRIEGKIL